MEFAAQGWFTSYRCIPASNQSGLVSKPPRFTRKFAEPNRQPTLATLDASAPWAERRAHPRGHARDEHSDAFCTRTISRAARSATKQTGLATELAERCAHRPQARVPSTRHAMARQHFPELLGRALGTKKTVHTNSRSSRAHREPYPSATRLAARRPAASRPGGYPHNENRPASGGSHARARKGCV